MLGASATAAAQDDENTDPDRPDVTNTAHLIPPGQLQIEFGGIRTRETPNQHIVGSPLTLRFGIGDWLEGRVGADNALIRLSGDAEASGVGNLQLGAKVRLWRERGGIPAISLLPAVTLPTANADKGLGSGETDVSATLLLSKDLGRSWHVDGNYSLGSIGGGKGQPRYAQHLLSVSVGADVAHWNPYFEVFWLSRTEAAGAPETSINSGVIYVVTSRFSLDGGIAFGIAGPAPEFAAFGGFSLRLGRKSQGQSVSSSAGASISRSRPFSRS